jgi:hypothetical protein
MSRNGLRSIRAGLPVSWVCGGVLGLCRRRWYVIFDILTSVIVVVPVTRSCVSLFPPSPAVVTPGLLSQAQIAVSRSAMSLHAHCLLGVTVCLQSFSQCAKSLQQLSTNSYTGNATNSVIGYFILLIKS